MVKLDIAHIIEPVEDIKKFILSGKAIFTIEGNSSRFTYKVVKKEFEHGTLYFVNVLTGSDNENSYTYMGTIYPKRNEFRLTTKSKISNTAPSFIAFNYFFKNLTFNRIHKDMTFYHNGCCGACGRLLTVPESIATGLGPTCAKK